jgi:MoaA/NifB/PqqE/SkfB family radical SAM enzyme
MLYLQLLYRCNFECLFCFHGERLKHADAFTAEQAINLMALMSERYDTEAVTLLGGEPFVYKHLTQVVHHAKRELGLRVEICTNGYRIERRLAEIAPEVDLLRVSLEGLGNTNDRLRKTGSFRGALGVLKTAHDLGIATGATMTVNARNITEVLPLAQFLQEFGVGQLKLHCLRSVGHAAVRSELIVTDPAAYFRLRKELQEADLALEVIVDEDLSATGAPESDAPAGGPREIDRIEADPRGALTMSCKAVGRDSHAFWYDKTTGRITHRPTAGDELALAVPDVVYSRV